MDNNFQTLTTTTKKPRSSTTTNHHGDGGDEGCNTEAWETLSKSFRDVQSVLDQNRALINQVNQNHQSKIHGNMVKNVGLINEINGNISRVMGMYSDLNVNFSNIVHQRRGFNGKSDSGSDNGGDGDGKGGSES
ncbi:hypothetical protein Leryth_014424 [Lithospermum erythrorhizon]|nr:hypothetical protein Leryth_014424 [Lithospermum erythrorhizon]